MSQPQNSSSARPRARRVVVRRQQVVVRQPTTRAQRKPSRRAKSTDDFSLIFQDITRTITSAINRPIVLVVLLCVTALIYTHSDDFSSGVVGQWLSSESSRDSHLLKWLSENQMKFLGLLAFLPTVIDSPKDVQGILAVGSVLWVMLIPESSVYEYIIQSFCIHTYFRVRLQKSRTVLIIFVIVAYFAGFWTIMKKNPQNVAAPPASPAPPIFSRPEPRPGGRK
nr:hypothetical protein 2 [ssRNA positive-strand virus sp.]